MAGGPSTPALAIAVCQAGGLGFLAAGYKRADAVREDIHAVRAATDAPFGVNVFVPSAERADPGEVRAYLERIAPEAERQGAALGEPRSDDDDWDAKLELACAERPAMVSFTFGCPAAEVFARLRGAGISAWVTITNLAEARAAQAAGADGLIVQGTEAGGHRGGFIEDGSDEGGIGLLALLRITANATPLPMIASGGIMDGAALAAVLCAGAGAAQIGTALMLSPEAGTPPAYRAALQQERATALTRAFSGRRARGIVNRFMVEHGAEAPAAYPAVHHLTTPIRAAAREAGDAETINLWAGQTHALAGEAPAAEIVRRLAAEARASLAEAAERLGAS